MLYREIISVCAEIHTKHINALRVRVCVCVCMCERERERERGGVEFLILKQVVRTYRRCDLRR